MKRSFVGLILVASLVGSVCADQKTADTGTPYDLVLMEDRITFDNREEFMGRNMPLLVRDLGVRELDCMAFRTNLALLLDGVAYPFNIRNGIGGTGPAKIIPKTTWGTKVDLSRYDIPHDALQPGKHIVAVRNGPAQSNEITVFILGKPANKASEPGVAPPPKAER